MKKFNCTYSLEDNKIRIYPLTEERLSPEDYAKVKDAGFIWAPRQKLFVAPAWTPYRENVAVEFGGTIENEDITLEERAAERAARFDNYSEKRAADAESYANRADSLAEPFKDGQPILIGHHSQRKAEKLRDKIQSTMKKAVNFYDQSNYWQDRSAGVIAHAAAKANISTRINRIKGLQADERKQKKYFDNYSKYLNIFTSGKLTDENKNKFFGSYSGGISWRLKLTEDDEKNYQVPSYKDSNGYRSCYDLTQPEYNFPLSEIIARLIPSIDRSLAHCERWLTHYKMRISYEVQMLEASGHKMPDFKAIGAARRAKTTAAPIVNTPELKGLTRQCGSEREPVEVFTLTKAQAKEVDAHIRRADGFRYRVAMGCHLREFGLKYKNDNDHWRTYALFISDQKRVDVPAAKAAPVTEDAEDNNEARAV